MAGEAADSPKLLGKMLSAGRASLTMEHLGRRDLQMLLSAREASTDGTKAVLMSRLQVGCSICWDLVIMLAWLVQFLDQPTASALKMQTVHVALFENFLFHGFPVGSNQPPMHGRVIITLVPASNCYIVRLSNLCRCA